MGAKSLPEPAKDIALVGERTSSLHRLDAKYGFWPEEGALEGGHSTLRAGLLLISSDAIDSRTALVLRRFGANFHHRGRKLPHSGRPAWVAASMRGGTAQVSGTLAKTSTLLSISAPY